MTKETVNSESSGASRQPKAHPQRCETCDFHSENQYMDFCKGYAMSKDDPTEITMFIRDHGCASHSASQQRIDAVIKELEKKIVEYQNEVKEKENYCLSYRAAGIAEAIALLQAGRK